MEINGKPLPVQDVLSVFPGVDQSQRISSDYVVVELLTSEGLLVLKTPKSLARNLADGLSRAAEERRAAWVPDYRAARK